MNKTYACLLLMPLIEALGFRVIWSEATSAGMLLKPDFHKMLCHADETLVGESKLPQRVLRELRRSVLSRCLRGKRSEAENRREV